MTQQLPGGSYSGLRKVKAGLYEHVATGRLIIRTSGWEGSRGGLHDMWEYGYHDGRNLCVDGGEWFRTLRDAAEALR